MFTVFTGLKSYRTAIQQVIIFVQFFKTSDANFHEETMSLLDEISQFDNVHLEIELDNNKRLLVKHLSVASKIF